MVYTRCPHLHSEDCLNAFELKRSKQQGEWSQSDCLSTAGQGVRFIAGVYDKAAIWFYVFASNVIAFVNLRRQAVFDLYSPNAVGSRKLEHQIDFGTSGGAI